MNVPPGRPPAYSKPSRQSRCREMARRYYALGHTLDAIGRRYRCSKRTVIRDIAWAMSQDDVEADTLRRFAGMA
jgi:DNA-binding transcriptional regulator LsrR (DeoR family)